MNLDPNLGPGPQNRKPFFVFFVVSRLSLDFRASTRHPSRYGGRSLPCKRSFAGGPIASSLIGVLHEAPDARITPPIRLLWEARLAPMQPA